MITRRDAQITLDAACGVTYESLAQQHHLSIARIGQIVIRTREQIGLSSPRHPKEHIGLLIARKNRSRMADDFWGDNPESLYWRELVPNLPVNPDYMY